MDFKTIAAGIGRNDGQEAGRRDIRTPLRLSIYSARRSIEPALTINKYALYAQSIFSVFRNIPVALFGVSTNMPKTISKIMSTEQAKPPYISYVTFSTFLSKLVEAGVPERIDKTLMSSFSGTVQSYLMNTLKFFGLIDEADAPTQDLYDLIAAFNDVEAKKLVWRRIFERAYQPILEGVDYQKGTVGMLQERFQKQSLTGETIRKCHSFWISGCEDAGIILADRLKKLGSRPKSAPRTKRVAEAKLPDLKPADAQKPPLASGDDVAILRLNGDGSRVLRVQGPAEVTSSELQRIQSWLSFHFIVVSDDAVKNLPQTGKEETP